MKTKLIIGIALLIILGGGGGLAIAGYRHYQQTIGASVGAGPEQFFEVKSGQDAKAVAKGLVDAKLIKDQNVFVSYLQKTKLSATLKPGFYQLKPTQTTKEIADLVAAGKIFTYKVTIPEGFTLAQITARLKNLGVTDQSSFETALKQTYDYEALKSKPAKVSLEGYLFPDTYIYPYRVASDAVIRLMLDNLQAKLADPDVAAAVKASKFSTHQILTLASIVEAEARFAEDRPKIAEVFLNRLSIDMALESDPTTAYALGKSGKDLTREDLNSSSPYNTYRVKGLPPGPINAPGLDAIKATLKQKPAFSDSKVYLYFCAHSSGKVYYGTSLAEHQTNVTKNCRL